MKQSLWIWLAFFLSLGLIMLTSAQGSDVALDPELPAILAEKTAKIPADKRPRVIYLELGPLGLAAAGRSSVLCDVILEAGAVLPDSLGNGGLVPLAKGEWPKLNPEGIVIRSRDEKELRKLLAGPNFRNAPAVRNKQIWAFPDGLVDQAKDYQTYFAAWLAGTMYPREFGRTENLVRPQSQLSSKRLALPLAYVERAEIIDSRVLDFVHRSLVIRFKTPQEVISTSSGSLSGIAVIGNTYSPAPSWPLYHLLNYEGYLKLIYEVLKLDRSRTALLGTGADLNNLVEVTKKYQDLAVTVLITAGVEGNAIRAGRDEGAYMDPGTINVIVLTNRHLSPAAMANTIINVTEAKTAALWEMDIRSVQTGLLNPATGTGTDSVLVVQGQGREIAYSGGHTKIGQLIAEAVREGVTEAIFRQNGKTRQRSVSARLAERGLYYPELEDLFNEPRYRGLVESAFSLSDSWRFGQVTDLSAFESLALAAAGEIAGQPVTKLDPLAGSQDIPKPLALAVSALITGQRLKK
ncbi:MAG: adenosylcobinamide amidohydrolase [Deltaproteobacteria bacterium]|jgi:adenosylcobinamide amidohydrolase|nr:adenosylcobinamide amidohydrolase [Deltaproteobacteria bacterium]